MSPAQFILYVRENPRTVALVPTTAPEGHERFLSIGLVDIITNHGVSETRCRVTLESVQDSLRNYMPLARDAVYGCIGVFNYESGVSAMDAYIMLITNCHKVGELSSSNSNDKSSRHEVFRVTGVDALSLTGNHLDREELPYMPGSLDEDYYEDAMQYGSQNPCRPLISFFQRGTFYFSPSMDLTRNIQAQKLRLGVDEDLRMPDLKFTWNHYFMDVLYEFRNTLSSESRQVFDSLGFVIPLISGSIEIAPLSSVVPEAATPSAREGKVAIVSRASALRAGMRFLTRGIDDFGGVANEVETELLFITPEYTLSFVQLRGSVPVFWEQTGFQIGTHRIHLTRVPQAAYPAAKLHFEDILERYKSVHILNLLKAVPDAPGGGGGGGGGPSTPQTPGGERELSKAFETQIKMLGLPQQLLAYTAFDYHAAVRNNQHHRIKELILSIEGSIRRYQYFLMSNTDGTVFKLQRGAMRTNCMDCLDRTNIVQSVVARTVLTTYLNGCFYEEGNTAALDATLDSVSRLWSKNGNQLAIAYTGTGALKSEVTATGKSTFSGILSDFSKSVNRLLQNNIYDERKQSVIDTVMGRDPITSPPLIWFDPLAEMLEQEIQRELSRVSRRRTVPIFATTYNLHGRPYCGENLEEWLRLPRDSIPDIVAIAFQEIVDLNVGQVLAASNANRLVWERTVMELLNIQLRQRGHGSEYVLIRSDQLVGVSLMIVTHNTVLPRMRNISSIKHKTGLWGMAGNKGAVAVSFDLDDSSFCIINSHLASGTTNVAERNDDFYNIYTNTRFMRNKGIDDHNYVLWLGDLNYRVDLPNPIVRDLVWKGDLDGLLRYDQLKAQAKQGRIFRDYQEGDIMFPPTYKYDTGTNNYDTSDKQRVPSWTDRILFRGQGLKLCAYYRDELTFSDHKPVSAVFEAQVVSVDKRARTRIMRKIHTEFSECGVGGPVLAFGSKYGNGSGSYPPWDAATREGLSRDPPVDVLVEVEGDDDSKEKSVEKPKRRPPPPPPPPPLPVTKPTRKLSGGRAIAANDGANDGSQQWWWDEPLDSDAARRLAQLRPATHGTVGLNPFSVWGESSGNSKNARSSLPNLMEDTAILIDTADDPIPAPPRK